MNVAEFESWLNAVENPCGDFSQAEAKAKLIETFRQSQDNYQVLLDDAVEMRTRVEVLKTALRTVRDLICATASIILLPGRKTLNGACVSRSVVTNAYRACGVIDDTLEVKQAKLVPIWSGSNARKSGNGQDSEGRTGSESMRKVQ